jgi:hypothetical protein
MSATTSRDQTFKLEIISGKSGEQPIQIGVFTFDLQGEKVNKLSRHVLGQFELWLPELEKTQKCLLLKDKPF